MNVMAIHIIKISCRLKLDCWFLASKFKTSSAVFLNHTALHYMDALGQRIVNEYDCPFLSMTNLIYCVPSHSVNHAVSVVHECTHTCSFVNCSARELNMKMYSCLILHLYMTGQIKCIALMFIVLICKCSNSDVYNCCPSPSNRLYCDHKLHYLAI